ncbi:MAG: beta-carotene 15,15'-monooxygenase [Sulfuricurvum sp. PC08-66]|nr:MAG: beta-carotene 15,15'-monooxygenase [Sulfuricurvum sp. PC08-66]
MASIDIWTVFVVAFLGSVGHCIGMCGGFILAYSGAKIGTDWSRAHQSMAHFLYNIGRVTSYVILGAIFGLIGSAFIITLSTWGVLLIVVGLLMVLMGLSLMGKLRFLTVIESSIASSKLYASLYRRTIASPSLGSFYLLGVLNGFVPCGLVYIFGTFALSSGSIVDGMLIMAVFGVATIPTLFTFGFLAGLIQKSRFRALALTIAALLVMGYGLFTLAKGTMMLVKPDMIETKIEMMKTKELQLLNAK